METVIIKRYSMAFKQAVVREYEAGESINGLSRKYGITGSMTVQKWVKQFGRYGTRHKLMVIQKPEERNQISKLEARVAELEKALAQATLDNLMLKATLEVVEDHYNIKPKKTTARSSSTVPSKQPKTSR